MMGVGDLRHSRASAYEISRDFCAGTLFPCHETLKPVIVNKDSEEEMMVKIMPDDHETLLSSCSEFDLTFCISSFFSFFLSTKFRNVLSYS